MLARASLNFAVHGYRLFLPQGVRALPARSLDAWRVFDVIRTSALTPTEARFASEFYLGNSTDRFAAEFILSYRDTSDQPTWRAPMRTNVSLWRREEGRTNRDRNSGTYRAITELLARRGLGGEWVRSDKNVIGTFVRTRWHVSEPAWKFDLATPEILCEPIDG